MLITHDNDIRMCIDALCICMSCSNVRYPSIKLLFMGSEMINLPSCLGRHSIQEKSLLLNQYFCVLVKNL